jgi:hypothetical protein
MVVAVADLASVQLLAAEERDTWRDNLCQATKGQILRKQPCVPQQTETSSIVSSSLAALASLNCALLSLPESYSPLAGQEELHDCNNERLRYEVL